MADDPVFRVTEMTVQARSEALHAAVVTHVGSDSMSENAVLRTATKYADWIINGKLGDENFPDIESERFFRGSFRGPRPAFQLVDEVQDAPDPEQ